MTSFMPLKGGNGTVRPSPALRRERAEPLVGTGGGRVCPREGGDRLREPDTVQADSIARSGGTEWISAAGRARQASHF